MKLYRISRGVQAGAMALLAALCIAGTLGTCRQQTARVQSADAGEAEGERPGITITVKERHEAEPESADGGDRAQEDPEEGAKIYAAILDKCQVVKDCYIVGYAPELVEGWRPENRNENGLYMTASGMWAMPGYCVATDPEIIPTGATVIIEGRVYVAADRGVKGKVIDVMVTPEEALEFGCRTADVYWCMEGE